MGLALAVAATLTAAPAMASVRIYFSNGNASGDYTKRYEPSYIPFGDSSFPHGPPLGTLELSDDDFCREP